MRQIQLRQQPSARVSTPAQVTARSAVPEVVDTLDRAAALWTTRRIRCFLMLLEPPVRAAHR